MRDVLVFQLKMALDNLRDFALMPVSLVAALFDLIVKGGEHHGTLFYQVLRWGAHSEEVIDVYSAIADRKKPVNPNYTVDAVVARLQGVLVRECEKGGTAASIRQAMDRVFDQVHRETQGPRDRTVDAVLRISEKVRGTLQNEQGSGTDVSTDPKPK